MPIRIMIAEGGHAISSRMGDVTDAYPGYEIVGIARDGQEAIQTSVQFQPDIVLAAFDLPGISGPKTCEILNAIAPDIMVALVVESVDRMSTEAAMCAGARAIVTPDLAAADFMALIDELAEIRRRRGSPELLDWKDPSKHPKIISISGAKGGVGKTTISVNLAVMLARQFPNKVALLDLHSQFGDVSTMMNVTPERTIMDLAPVSNELDFDILKGYITRHASGVHILATSDKPAPLDGLTIECLDNVLYLLKREYRYIVIDVPALLQNITLRALKHSKMILLVANLFDLTTCADTAKLSRALEEESIPSNNIGVIINRVSKTNQIPPSEIAKLFDGRIAARIPNDNRLVSSINNGMPLALRSGDSPWMQSMNMLAMAITKSSDHHSETPVKQTSLRKRWWG